jgi:hypothetical protein
MRVGKISETLFACQVSFCVDVHFFFKFILNFTRVTLQAPHEVRIRKKNFARDKATTSRDHGDTK